MTINSLAPEATHEFAASIVGPEHAKVIGECCSAVPADAQQASEILRFANENGLAVNVEGSGSKLGWINPGRTDLRVLTHRMSTMREHPWQDMTCTVEAGCAWQAMQTALAEHGQHVALDPLWPARATVGGVVAANDSGALRLRYGGLRDLVIGMTLVLADGTIARSGGKVVKNVAGYDLPKLLCGSFGTLALITEVTFRLHSIARQTAWAAWPA
jgi:glycolate oxidase FAD binding subunit